MQGVEPTPWHLRCGKWFCMEAPRMDLATLVGMIVGSALVVVAIVLGGSGLGPFFNAPSLLIVIGGSISAVLIRFPMKDFFTAMKAGFGRAFKDSTEDPLEIIENARELADVARKKGLIALEEIEVSNELMAKGIQYCVDGRDSEFIERMMGREITASIRRNQTGERVFRALGDAAPAFGMIGTLVGLVQMLMELSDPSAIGPAMAVALLTTLYGALLGNLVFLPMADKLNHRASQENQVRGLIMDAVLGVSSGTSPRVLEEVLLVGLEPKKADEDGADAAAEPAEAT